METKCQRFHVGGYDEPHPHSEGEWVPVDVADDLYEALEMMVEMIKMRGFGRQAAIDTANAALAKARGES